MSWIGWRRLLPRLPSSGRVSSSYPLICLAVWSKTLDAGSRTQMSALSTIGPGGHHVIRSTDYLVNVRCSIGKRGSPEGGELGTTLSPRPARTPVPRYLGR